MVLRSQAKPDQEHEDASPSKHQKPVVHGNSNEIEHLSSANSKVCN
jgi:hypothetical protein